MAQELKAKKMFDALQKQLKKSRDLRECESRIYEKMM
jgi:hypothetical protein